MKISKSNVIVGIILFILGFIARDLIDLIFMIPDWFKGFLAWGEQDSVHATMFTGITAIIAAVIAFISVFSPQIWQAIVKKQKDAKTWKSKCKSVMQHIVLMTTDITNKIDATKGNKDLRTLHKVLAFGKVEKGADLSLSTGHSMYPFNERDLPHMRNQILEAFIGYEATVNILAQIMQQMTDQLNYLDDLVRQGKKVSDKDYVMGDEWYEALVDAIEKVDDKGKALCESLNKSFADQLYQ